jgi:hypothetical protein
VEKSKHVYMSFHVVRASSGSPESLNKYTQPLEAAVAAASVVVVVRGPFPGRFYILFANSFIKTLQTVCGE